MVRDHDTPATICSNTCLQFVLHPDSATFQADEGEPIVWCRRSQVKIKYGPEGFVSPDLAHCTFDLLRTSRLKRPAHLSKEIMQCLMHGGVSPESLLRIFRAQLDAELKDVSDMDCKYATLKVFDYVARSENVYQARIRREAIGLSRVLGYGDDSDGSDGIFDAEDGIGEQSTPWAPDLVSGLPSSLAETVMAFLAAGFHPDDNAVLFAKLKAVIKMAIEKAVLRYKVCLRLSVEGFAVPGEETISYH
jgi:RNA-dependent RNA polymerase